MEINAVQSANSAPRSERASAPTKPNAPAAESDAKKTEPQKQSSSQSEPSPSVSVSISQEGVNRAREANKAEDSNDAKDNSDNRNAETQASNDDKYDKQGSASLPADDNNAVLKKFE
jgi:hypothetical protein